MLLNTREISYIAVSKGVVMPKAKVLEVRDLQIEIQSGKTWKTIVRSSTFDVWGDEVLGVVGESGSGKSITALAVMGLLPKGISRVSNGEIVFEGEIISTLPDNAYRKLRGRVISMVFQEPMSSLNPSMKCGKQVEEILKEHTSLRGKSLKQEVLSLFEKVRLPNPEELYRKYPHQISGGQKQRVMIAMAIACKPKLLIADEPTTALDVTIQKEIVLLLKELQEETGMSVLFITHDLALIAQIADRVLVMYQGRIVEQGVVDQVFKYPKELYTRALLSARPPKGKRLHRLPTIEDFLEDRVGSKEVTAEERKRKHRKIYSQKPLLQVVDIEKEYVTKGNWFASKRFKALQKVSLAIYEGETLGLVGESGCGKSTFGNVILQLDRATEGKVFYKGEDITTLKGRALKEFRREVQIVFQDPYSSLNPRLKIGEAIMEPMHVHGLHNSERDRKQKALEILERVGLGAETFYRYPHEFSGGQRQRIGIARTIAVQPKLIVCDESVSALDISVQAQVLNLLNELKDSYGFTYLFISHDLAVVQYMSDQVAVMNKGKIEEVQEADALYESPQTAYTRKLIDSIPQSPY